MAAPMNALRRFLADCSGHTTIEYGMIATFVAIGIISALAVMGDSASGMFTQLLADWQSAAAEQAE
jgi:Flp pilus assembly pilin Flp